jgi:hypothetical protein
MSILDDAIREHLELKRAHGADEAELKKLEDEAFGPPQRPEVDPFAEAPTEFLSPEGEAEQAEAPSGRREPNIADLQEAPPAPEESAPEAPPAEEEQPATEMQAVTESEGDQPSEAGHSTQERHAIAEQPTEYFDVEAEIDSEEAPAEAVAPSDEDLADAEQAEPRLGPVDQLDELESEAIEVETTEEPLDDAEEDDFFSEQRLSDELNQALETPLPGEPEVAPRSEEPIPPGPHTEETEAHYAEREEAGDDEAPEDEPPHEEEPTQLYDVEAEEGEETPDEDEDTDPPAATYEPDTDSHEDVLEDTPEFLEDAPEDDDLWFEQRPPKDFDFDD